MPPDSGMVCTACGEGLGAPQDELHDPEGRHQISQEIGIEPENPDAHLEVTDGPGDSTRLNCTREKSFTKVVPIEEYQAETQEEGGREGSGTSPSENRETQPQQPRQQQPRPQPPQAPVYEFKEDHTPEDLLEKVITNESYGLNEAQIKEVKSWGDIYDGQIPPNELENILQNLKGISNQKANLMSDKYAMMLNKWTREKADDNAGPRIGSRASPQMQMPGGGGGGGPPQGPQKPPQQKPQGGPPQGEEPKTPRKARKTSRERRVERRQEAMDEAIEEFSLQFAQNMAQDAGTFFSEMRDVMATVIRKKAESDPEWFFEKTQKWDMDIFDEFMTASDAKKEEQQQTTPEADMEVDSALDRVMGEEEPEVKPSQRTSPQEPQQQPQQQPSQEYPEVEELPTTREEPQDDSEMTAMEQKVEQMMEEPPEETEEEIEDDEIEQMFEELEG